MQLHCQIPYKIIEKKNKKKTHATNYHFPNPAKSPGKCCDNALKRLQKFQIVTKMPQLCCINVAFSQCILVLLLLLLLLIVIIK